MRAVRMIAGRAFGRLSGQITAVLAVAAFLSASGALFADGLLAAEGTSVSAPSVWAVSVAAVLPLLASVLAMRLWSDDGVPGRTELDLAVPVRESSFAYGRFLAVFLAVAGSLVLALVVPLVVLPRCAPALAPELTVAKFLPALAALLVFSVPLAAIGSLAGACFRQPALAAVASAAVTCLLPRAAYRAMLAWIPAVRMKFAESPVSSLVADAADGFFSIGAAATSLAVAAFAIYAASKAFAARRLAGDGNARLKVSSMAAVASALTAALLFSALAVRMDAVFEWPGATRTAAFSARTREILSGASRAVRVTACIRRDSPDFHPVARLLRAISAESRSGAGVTCSFVDPRWDPNAASRLVRSGIGEGMLVFEAGRRRISLPVKEADERACASAIQRLSMPAKTDTVLFTAGHGEPSIDDFGPSGLGEAVRALRQEGYRVGTLFSPTSTIPAECSVVAVAGARTPFSAAELRDVGLFLAQGGRLLAVVSGDSGAGIRPLLESNGVSAGEGSRTDAAPEGPCIVATSFGDHAVSRPLAGSAVSFAPDAVRFRDQGDRDKAGGGYALSPLCTHNGSVLAVAAEKGSVLKSDLAIRPARIVAVGDPSFMRNDALASRANSNRDFLLNAMAWLAGLDISGSAGVAADVLLARMDRAGRIRFTAIAAAGVPALIALIGLAAALGRRRRE